MESKSIVRRYFNTDEKDSIIFAGQGTTSCVNKLIKLLNLKEYVSFYSEIQKLDKIYQKFKDVFKNEEDLNKYFLELNAPIIEDIYLKFSTLFEISNFCYLNRWGSYDCTLCRMTFSQESQYNEHESGDVHKFNLEKCARIDNKIFKFDFKKSKENFIFELLKNSYQLEPVVFLSILEHNSNALPWRETGAKIVYIENDDSGNLDYDILQKEVEKHSENKIKIGSFIAASNISGKLIDIDLISLIMHKNEALVFFDYATASPYIKIDMNRPLNKKYREILGFTKIFKNEDESLIYKDGLFFSPHKLLGGPNTPGVLIVKQHVVRNLLIPSEPGGGVVLFVRKERQNYVKNIEAREESGTPDIIGSVRIGLSILLREKVDHEFILKREDEINRYAMSRLRKIPNIFVIGDDSHDNIKRIPIYSFVIKFNGKLFHHNFVSALLNDLFGIQSRPGCSCASTYGQQALGLEEEYVELLEKLVCNGSEIFRPGYSRVNLPYFYPMYIIKYILDVIEYVAKYGWLFLPQYAFKIESAKYYHRKEDEEKRRWLDQIDFNAEEGRILIPDLVKDKSQQITKEILEKNLSDAVEIAKNIKNISKHIIGKAKLNLKILFKDLEEYRWFLLPDDVENLFYDDEYLIKGLSSIETPLEIRFKLEGIKNKNSSKKETINKEVFLDETKKDEIKKVISAINESSPSNLPELNEISINDFKISKKINQDFVLFPEIPKKIIKLVGEASKDFEMLKDGDRILVGLSGGKDSLSLLHILLYLQKKVPFKIEIGGVTVDPQSSDYNPRPLIEYMKKLGVKYFFESDPILERAKKSLQNDSICAYCARMKRGIIYKCARREGYNVIALGQHLDDLAESFLMSSFHNGLLRTMKANYVIDQGDLRVIRPLIYCREKLFKEFTLKTNIPVIQENCPACFSAPTERHRIKVLLAQQENIYPNLFSSLQKAMKPLMKGLIESGNKKDDIEI